MSKCFWSISGICKLINNYWVELSQNIVFVSGEQDVNKIAIYVVTAKFKHLFLLYSPFFFSLFFLNKFTRSLECKFRCYMHWSLYNVDFMLQQNDAYEHHYYFACSSVTGELVTQLSTFLISDKINALFLFHVNSYHHLYLQDLDFKRVT